MRIKRNKKLIFKEKDINLKVLQKEDILEIIKIISWEDWFSKFEKISN